MFTRPLRSDTQHKTAAFVEKCRNVNDIEAGAAGSEKYFDRCAHRVDSLKFEA